MLGAQIALFVMSILFTDGVTEGAFISSSSSSSYSSVSMLSCFIKPALMSDRQLQTSCLSLCKSVYVSFPSFSLPPPLSLSPSLDIPLLVLHFPLFSPSTFVHFFCHLTFIFFPFTRLYLTLSLPPCRAVSSLSNPASLSSPSHSGTQLSDMALNRIALTQSEFGMRRGVGWGGGISSKRLLAIGKQLLWSRNQGETDRQKRGNRD